MLEGRPYRAPGREPTIKRAAQLSDVVVRRAPSVERAPVEQDEEQAVQQMPAPTFSLSSRPA